MSSIDEHTNDQIARANVSGRTPVVFIHGLWLLASSWDRWGVVFEEAGYAPVLAGWPDDPGTVEDQSGFREPLCGEDAAFDSHRR